jgi:hypothetical protein
VLEPEVVDFGHAVARAEDQVDESVIVVGLAEPVREVALDLVAGRGQRLQRPLEVAHVDEQVEVLGMADDPGVAGEGVGAADQERDSVLLELPHGPAVELRDLRSELVG